LLIGILRSCDEEGIVGVVGDTFDPLGIEDFLNDRRKFLKKCGARGNSEWNAKFVEIETKDFHSQIIVILWVYTEETECVFDVDFCEETGWADLGDCPKNVLKTDVDTGDWKESGVDTVFGFPSGVRKVVDDSQFLCAFLWDGAERGDLEVGERRGNEGARRPSHLNFFLERLKDFQSL